LYFYELHEGDDDVFSDLLLVSDEQIEPEDFFELVQSIRTRLQDSFEEDTLIEAIALELEREHGFTFISDARLTASVHVSPDDAENRLISLDDEMLESAEFRSILAEFDGDGVRNN
jgi:polyphosphate kinase